MWRQFSIQQIIYIFISTTSASIAKIYCQLRFHYNQANGTSRLYFRPTKFVMYPYLSFDKKLISILYVKFIYRKNVRTWKEYRFNCKYSAKISNIRTIWENISTRCPVCLRRVNNLSKRITFPLPFSIITSLSMFSSSGGRVNDVWLQHFLSSIIIFTKLDTFPFSPLLRAL